MGFSFHSAENVMTESSSNGSLHFASQAAVSNPNPETESSADQERKNDDIQIQLLKHDSGTIQQEEINYSNPVFLQPTQNRLSYSI